MKKTNQQIHHERILELAKIDKNLYDLRQDIINAGIYIRKLNDALTSDEGMDQSVRDEIYEKIDVWESNKIVIAIDRCSLFKRRNELKSYLPEALNSEYAIELEEACKALDKKILDDKSRKGKSINLATYESIVRRKKASNQSRTTVDVCREIADETNDNLETIKKRYNRGNTESLSRKRK